MTVRSSAKRSSAKGRGLRHTATKTAKRTTRSYPSRAEADPTDATLQRIRSRGKEITDRIDDILARLA